MNLYLDSDGGYWVGNEKLGVMFLNDEMFSPGYEYTAEMWDYDQAVKTFHLVLNAVGG